MSSLIYYKKFVKTLKRAGFQINPYDTCVVNFLVNDKHKTGFLRVDDCKLSHQYSKVNDEFINTLRDEYESVFEDGSGKMKLSRVKVHEYLGMTLEYSLKGQINITVLYYINEMLDLLEREEPKDSGTKSSAAPMNLFVVGEYCDKLIKEKS